MELNNWYKEKVLSNQEAPPDSVWESIQDDLDTELVWERLSANLPAKTAKKAPLWIYRSVAASMVLLLGLSIMLFLFGRYNPTFRSPAIVLEDFLSDPQSIPAEPENNPDQIIVSLETTPVATAPIDNQEQIFSGSFHQDDNIAEEKITIIPIYPVELLSSQEVAKLAAPQGFVSGVKQQVFGEETLALVSGRKNYPSFSLGWFGQYANTWLLNPKTINGLQSQELTATNASFGSNLGLTSFVWLSDRSGLRADFFLIVQNRQNYFEYINGQYLQTGLELDYSGVSLMLARKFGRKNLQHTVNLGVYTAFLQQARQFTGNNAQVITNEYANNDFGLIAGYEYHWPLGNNLFFGTGLFVKAGLLNSFSGNQEIPDFLNRTRNAAFILSLSLNYSIF